MLRPTRIERCNRCHLERYKRRIKRDFQKTKMYNSRTAIRFVEEKNICNGGVDVFVVKYDPDKDNLTKEDISCEWHCWLMNLADECSCKEEKK